jgi:hypothetical protein
LTPVQFKCIFITSFFLSTAKLGSFIFRIHNNNLATTTNYQVLMNCNKVHRAVLAGVLTNQACVLSVDDTTDDVSTAVISTNADADVLTLVIYVVAVYTCVAAC